MEVTDEEQAAMAIKLTDNVRQLIRDEVKAALEDWAFCSSFHKGPLADTILRTMSTDNSLQNLLAQVIATKLMKY
jgi:hypothetical protein